MELAIHVVDLARITAAELKQPGILQFAFVLPREKRPKGGTARVVSSYSAFRKWNYFA
jgi:hypothetical protein